MLAVVLIVQNSTFTVTYGMGIMPRGWSHVELKPPLNISEIDSEIVEIVGLFCEDQKSVFRGRPCVSVNVKIKLLVLLS